MKKLIAIILILHAGILFGNWPFQQKPMLGELIDWSHPLSKSLVGCWLMNEGTGNKIQDLSGNGRTGVEQTDSVWVPGVYGCARYFSGDDYISIPAMTSLPNGLYTILVWFKSSNVGPQTFFSVGKTSSATPFVALDMGGDERVQLYHRDDASALANCSGTGKLINDGIWHCVTIIRSASNTFSTYLDGGHIKTITQAIGATTIDTTQIGVLRRNTFSQYTVGNISYVLVYNRALSASEIALLYREPFCFMAEDLPVSMMYEYAVVEEPGQVIFIQMSAIPLFLIPMIVFLMRGKNVK